MIKWRRRAAASRPVSPSAAPSRPKARSGRRRRWPRGGTGGLDFSAVRDLQTWRNGLKEKMEPSSVNRTRTRLRAALELAATLDHRLTNRHVFRLGLRGLPGSNKARRIVLPDADVLRIVKAGYEIDRAFGLLVEVLAVTGARSGPIWPVVVSTLPAGQR